LWSWQPGHVQLVAVLARAEGRVVGVGQDAACFAGREVAAQPGLLLSHGFALKVAVERDQVPGAEVEAVVALVRLAGPPAPIGVVGRGFGAAVFVVAGHGPTARLVPAPGEVVAALELGLGATPVGQVAEDEDSAGQAVEQCGGRGRAGLGAVAVMPVLQLPKQAALAKGDVAGGKHGDRLRLGPRGGRQAGQTTEQEEEGSEAAESHGLTRAFQ
jgi:hypothetical protein